jgi:predicted dehydrogenase
MVGFNRRFAPLARELRTRLGGRGPMVITYRVNAGRLPASHWTHDPDVGGGRIVGEVCHFVDFASFLSDGMPTGASAVAVGGGSEPREDSLLGTVRLSDGSIAQIAYTAFGDSELSKERVELLGEAGAAVLDDFRQLDIYATGAHDTIRGKRDKGHAAELDAFVTACRTGEHAWSLHEMTAVMRATFEIRDALRSEPVAQA